ncbi:TPA: helix-turn-helix transcriptional regulator, partial [Enterobacter asburiae]|nr:helix-turn-helix transcriptional regulator [Enterobacter asburiae]
MLNVLIRDHDTLYMSSLKLFLSELFLSYYQRDVDFLPVFDVENVSKADVIIIGFGPGEFYTCTPELKFRKKSIIIGIVDHEKETPGVIKTCTHDIVFIRRDLSLKDLQRKIISL